MGENNENTVENAVENTTNSANPVNSNDSEILKFMKKQVFYQRISTACMIIVALVAVLAVCYVVPQVKVTLNYVNSVAIHAEESLELVDTMTNELTDASRNLNSLVDNNADDLTKAVKSLSEIDFVGLNQAIADLQDAIGPMAAFMNRFK